MINFLKETINQLEFHNKTFDDVIWIGNDEYEISKEDFMKLADIYYDNGYGGAEIAEDLYIVGTDWWLERDEYDGSEWWEYKTLPTRSENPKKIEALSRTQAKDYWCLSSLADINSNSQDF